MIKKLFLVIFAFCVPLCFANETINYWKTLEKAERAFDVNDLGTAIVLAQNAKEMRKTQYQKYKKIIENATSPLAVQQAGDKISENIYILNLRNSKEETALMNSILIQAGKDRFNDSLTEMISYLEEMQNFPEADFLIGRIYLAEGEYEISEKYLKQALSYKILLDIPDVEYDILYEIAYLAELQNNFDLYEESLLAIAAKSEYYNENTEFTTYTKSAVKFAKDVKPTVYGQVETASQKFFLLYRVDSKRTIQAFNMLSEYYDGKLNEKSFSFTVLSVLASFSRINEVLTYRQNEYVYTDLNNFFETALQFNDINDWLITNDVWNQFLLFAKQLETNKNQVFSDELANILVAYCPIDRVKKEAELLVK